MAPPPPAVAAPPPSAAAAPPPPPPAAAAENGSKSKKRRPHAVVVPWPGQGHINPLVHLSRRLIQQAGYIITFVNTEHNHERVIRSLKKKNVKVKDVIDGTDSDAAAAAAAAAEFEEEDIRFVSIPDGMPHDSDRMAEIPELCRCIEQVMPSFFEKLVDDLMLGTNPVTLILSDVFVLHTQDVANKFSIPRVGFWTQCAASFAIHLYCARGYRAPPEAYEGARAITGIPGCPPLSQSEMLTFLQPYDAGDFMFRFFTEPFLRLGESEAILLNTYEELEGECIRELEEEEEVGTKLYRVGPILPESFFKQRREEAAAAAAAAAEEAEAAAAAENGIEDKTPALWEEDYECLKWLDEREKESVVYVAFGSITVLRKEVVAEFAAALEESGVSFLWVLRPGMIQDVSNVKEAMPEGWWERIRQRGKVIDWAPQLNVLTHPSVAAFLTHGGWNSTLEGVAAGQPMLGFPYFTDQMLNCRCIQESWRIGLSLQPDISGLVSRHSIRRQLEDVVANPNMRANARRLKHSAQLASLSSSGSSSSNLLAFIAQSLQTLA